MDQNPETIQTAFGELKIEQPKISRQKRLRSNTAVMLDLLEKIPVNTSVVIHPTDRDDPEAQLIDLQKRARNTMSRYSKDEASPLHGRELTSVLEKQPLGLRLTIIASR